MDTIINQAKHSLTQDINLLIARMNLKIHGAFSPSSLYLSPSQQKFIVNDKSSLVIDDELVLTLTHQRINRRKTWKKHICQTKIWELWLDKSGHFIFCNPLQPLLRQLVIAPDFKTGDIYGDFTTTEHGQLKPLPQDLEIVIFSNWLAKYGDLILHAAGVSFAGKGYVFAGDSGVGKSTLAAALSHIPGMEVLGEDQVILRSITGKFWVFGTPWHVDPLFCSPQGVPLEGLYFLTRDEQEGIKTLSPVDGTSRLLSTAFIPYYRIDAVTA